MAIGSREWTVFVYRPDESFHVTDVMLVTAIEVSADADGGKKPGGNGSTVG
jgi:hypothetical protein